MAIEEDIWLEDGTFGWALFTGCEGECGEFRAFFVRREDADQALEQVEDENRPYYFDAAVAPALLTKHGLFCPDDFEIDDEAKVRAAYASASRDQPAEQPAAADGEGGT